MIPNQKVYDWSTTYIATCTTCEVEYDNQDFMGGMMNSTSCPLTPFSLKL